MRGHRTYLDIAEPVTTLAVKPPHPKGHRKWLEIPSRYAAEGVRAA
jgi:hypothetical protein